MAVLRVIDVQREPIYSQGMEGNTVDERAMHQWFVLISEKERREMVAGIPGCYTFGAVGMLQRLPVAAQEKVRAAYVLHLEEVARLEEAHPEN